MGDRVSISFVRQGDTHRPDNRWYAEDQESVTLFEHWGGIELPKLAVQYVQERNLLHINDGGEPLSRFDPDTVMIDFILWLKETGKMEYPNGSNFYLGKDAQDGDNGDNGHFRIIINQEAHIILIERIYTRNWHAFEKLVLTPTELAVLE